MVARGTRMILRLRNWRIAWWALSGKALVCALVTAGCVKEDRKCPTVGQYQCDFYVEALLICAATEAGHNEWSTAQICPHGYYCTSAAQDPSKACQPFGEEPDGDTQDADAGDGEPDSVEGFVERMFPE